jgi:hypothetical protein
MHDVLAGLPEWQQLEQRLAELDRLRALYASRDLQARQERETEQATYTAAYQAAVEAGEEPPPRPPQRPEEPSRTGELRQQALLVADQQRSVMAGLRPQVRQRAQDREAELLALARDTKLGELEPIRAELEQVCLTLRQVLGDGPDHQTTVDLGDLAVAAVDGGSVLFVPVAGARISMERPGPPAGVVMTDRTPSETAGQVLHASNLANRRLAESQR